MDALVKAKHCILDAQEALRDDGGQAVRVDTAMERLAAALVELGKEQQARHARDAARAA